MSVRIMTRVWDLELPDSEKIVLLALADCANDEGHCWPGLASLERKCSKSRRTIQTCIQALVAKGHLTRREVFGKGCNYTIHPRSDCTGAEAAPLQPLRETPAAVAPKPSVNRKSTSGAKAPSVSRGVSIDAFIECINDPDLVVFWTWAVENMSWTAADAKLELSRFVDSARAAGRIYKDWGAAWRNWCRSPFCKTKPLSEKLAYRKEPMRV